MELNTPLAERMRPKNLTDFIGQEHLLKPSGSIQMALKSTHLPSMILWGPPGVGKTTLARIIAEISGRTVHHLSAINSGVKDIRDIIGQSEKQHLFSGKSPILFIDEIHRFNKSQQDSLLGAVEKGSVVLIGATTENPSFEVNAALLSRCQVFILKEHSKTDLIQLIENALLEDKWLKSLPIRKIEHEALIAYSGGDARKLLNLLEAAVMQVNDQSEIIISNELVKNMAAENPLLYDKNGEQHYDIISAFIKSIRGSDPNAGVYWLARMLQAGEDPKFIARRLLILASEDIGLANPTAFVMANNCFQAVNVIGFPESRIILSQTVIYLATSPKSNSAYLAINDAQKLVEETGNLPVPLHLRNAPTKLMKDLNYGNDYKYPHDFPNNFTPQQYMPDDLQSKTIYHSGENDKEKIIDSIQNKRWNKKKGT